MADRNLTEVIDAMLAVVPAEWTGLIERLRSVREKVMYTAPEIMANLWHATHAILIDQGEPREDWQRAVADIFSGRRAS